MANASDVSSLLQVKEELANFSDFAPLIRDGFTKKTFEDFINEAKIVSAVSELEAFKPVLTQDDDALLSAQASDVLVCIARIYAEAIDLFGDKLEATKWMTSPRYTLGEQVPIQMLDTTVGFETVLLELHRIQYGIAS